MSDPYAPDFVSQLRIETARTRCLQRIGSFATKYEPILGRLSEHEFRGLVAAVVAENKRREPMAAERLGDEIAAAEDKAAGLSVRKLDRP